MIGGRDISYPHAPSLVDLRRVLATIRLWWPDAVVSDDQHAAIVPPPTIPCAWYVARDRATSHRLEKEGVTQAVEPYFISVYAEPDAILFVVGCDEGCPGALLVTEIIAALKEARR
jgi:hypothetical protein